MTLDVRAPVLAAAADLIALSHSIHAEPELAFAEHRSVAKLTELLGARGFEVRRPVAGLDTAFTAECGSGELVIGICAEYDALPGLGHACGHNIIAAAAVGAALALAAHADALGVTVRVIGTPAEETGGGKVLMLERGVFDDVAAAMMVHPGPLDIAGATSLALADLSVAYTGKEAHAAAAPEQGRNAGDAVTVAQVALGLLRQHLEPGQQLHGIVSEGGVAPNVVPAHTELLYYLRAPDADSLDRLRRRADDCFAAGALAAGCTHEVRVVSPPYAELRPDPWLVTAYREAALDLGRVLLPVEMERAHPLGSTDMGNVTTVLPAIHPVIGLDTGGAVTHQPEFAAACITGSADAAVLDGATALAATAAALASDPAQRARVLDGVASRSRGVCG
ncbi:M20 family metallopeptidase [Rhodococcus sp. D2-41]|uniref:Peptidase M20 domain-containing protein 2 n=1 Tax=Speluncibacter jeojiensis TaxID=2710754 RepID=A0A9X4RIV0_9ACTN|nr:M20 family metallopeptidase [Rhodococcus sp. D2-41]MDG3008856.1 M20 family metallopeptidase [Rhodococcus sp. D2-41]MDG3016476.1 M20 family metallopeptidase [Corynebacteriales bacterium D3-21]